METIMLLGLIDENFFKIMWGIGALIIFLIIIAYIFTDKNKEGLFKENFKIGIIRTLGTLTTIYFILLTIETILFFIYS